uniref:Myb_Cef domain-containing protein n=1 Tax=Echinostoma caproni TaxID=27848 RepID=A0A183ATT9_9TREM
LNINAGDPEGAMLGADNFHPGAKPTSGKSGLRQSLASLPAPRNNYEIFVPEEADVDGKTVDLDDSAAAEDDASGTAARIADQSDLDRLREKQQEAEAQAAWSKRSQVVRRGLPRPAEINHSILRSVPPTQTPQQESALSDLQRAEEMIKQEMITMMHYDNLLNPPPSQLDEATKQATTASGAVSTAQQKRYMQQAKTTHESYLRSTPFEQFDDSDLKEAESLLVDEMAVVRAGMNHGELSAEAYAKVWHECLSQVLYLPAHRRYTRANLVSKRDRIESHEKRLDQLRQLMADEAKRAAKLEKKLRILLGGYQSRAQTLMKAIQESVDQVEHSQMELITYERLHEQETGAIVRRLEILEADVERQQKRGVELQREYARLVRLLEEREADLFLAQNTDLAPPTSSANRATITNGPSQSPGAYEETTSSMCNGLPNDQSSNLIGPSPPATSSDLSELATTEMTKELDSQAVDKTTDSDVTGT